MNLIINPGNKKIYDFKKEIFGDLKSDERDQMAMIILSDSSKFKTQKEKENFIESLDDHSWIKYFQRDYDKLIKIKKVLYDEY